jgi:hypothetical protein
MSCAAVGGIEGRVYLQALRPRAHHRLTVGALVFVDLVIKGYIVRCMGVSSRLVALVREAANELCREWNKHLDDRRLFRAGGQHHARHRFLHLEQDGKSENGELTRER